MNKKISGKINVSGKAQGVVRVVQSFKEASEFKEGNIYVGFATEPYAIEALSKAAAVVLDVSETKKSPIHPAIVAGELGIPCIAGTHLASKILKTGDKVMVDADTGVVALH